MNKKMLFIGAMTGGGVATINNEVIKVFEDAGHGFAVVDTKATTCSCHLRRMRISVLRRIDILSALR